jgi:IclR family transcriptional regulator, acetate operon repressor
MVQSVEKAVEVLYAFDHAEPELGVMELSRRLGLHKSTVSRLLATLEQGDLVERNSDSGKYRLGVGLIALAGRVVRHADLRTVARPYLEDLAERCRETANLVVLHQDMCMNVEQFVPADRRVKDIGWIGRRTPLHATSTGKVLLAFAPAGEGEQLAARLTLTPYTPQTITDPDRLLQEMERIRGQGVAWGLEELETGLNSVAAPVRDHTGAVVAAVSLSGPAYRVTGSLLPELTSHVVETASLISRALGWDARGERTEQS